jgi:hypothetical protein
VRTVCRQAQVRELGPEASDFHIVPRANLAEGSFKYKRLASPGSEIRLIELLPGNFNDDIHARIFTAQLSEAGKSVDSRLCLKDLEKTLPNGWEVDETIDGRFIFYDGRSCQWDHPVAGFEPIKYQLSDGDDRFEPEYEALSYTWGQPDDGYDVFIEEGPFDKLARESCRLRIRRNLMSALRYLRSPQSSRVLWIDTLCIDQLHNEEKMAQVRRMGEIFRLAHRVVIWLGPEAEESALAFPVLSHLGQQIELLARGYSCDSPDSAGPFDRTSNLPYDDRIWDAIQDVCTRDWFKRVWVVQEAQLANSRSIMQCGSLTMLLKSWRGAVFYLNAHHMTPERLKPTLQALKNMTHPGAGFPFQDILNLTYGRECLDPRDYVYGILGLVPQKLAAKIQPSYSKQVGDVYKDTILAHMDHLQRLELLDFVYSEGRNLSGPSWVPDLSSKPGLTLNFTSQFAAGCSRAHFSYEAPGILHVLGLRSAAICSVSKPYDRDGGTPLDFLRSSQPIPTANGTYPTGETVSLALAVTLQQGCLRPRYAEWDHLPSVDEWHGLCDRLHIITPQDDRSVGSAEILPSEQKHIERSTDCCYGRALVQTKEGFIGLAPADTRPGMATTLEFLRYFITDEDIRPPGDMIVVLLGFDKPVILREAYSDRFRVIGPCFVHGLDDANALLGPLPKPWKVQISDGYVNRDQYRYFNEETGETTLEDPRLEPINDWERINHEPEADEPETYDYFRNRETGFIMNSDPRMSPEALEARGLPVRLFTLI